MRAGWEVEAEGSGHHSRPNGPTNYIDRGLSCIEWVLFSSSAFWVERWIARRSARSSASPAKVPTATAMSFPEPLPT